MKRAWLLSALPVICFLWSDARSDPAKYPQFAQQTLPKGVTPQFVKVDQLRGDIALGKAPLIIDVRSLEEYREARIKAAVSIPLQEMPNRLAEIPKNRPVVLY